MYLIKNALRSIARAKGRNVLIGLIAFVIAVSSCIALSIRQAAGSAKESGLQNMQVTARIAVNREALMKDAGTSGTERKNALSGMPELTLAELQSYAKSAHVKSFLYTLSSSLDASGALQAVDSNSTSGGTDTAKPGGASGSMGSQGDFTLVGYSSKDAMTDFVSGISKLIDGAMFDDTDAAANCLVNSELATLNNLKAGDSITLQNPNQTKETVTLKIAGIYTKTATDTDGGMGGFQPGNDPANQILMNYNALKIITDASAKNATTSTDETTGRTNTTALRSQTTGTYVFSDVAQYEAFREDAKTMGLTDDFTISSQDVESYEASLVPLETLSKFATWFFVIVVLVGGLILVALNLFHIRERKYEIGVLAAIGMKKRKVAAQFLAELLVVTFTAILLGTGVGALASVPVTNALLSTQITAQQNSQTKQQENFGMPGGQSASDGSSAQGERGRFGQAVDYVSEVSSATNWVVVMQLVAVGLLLTLFSGTVAVVSVLRYDPLKILSNRA